jgi:hypothetical protein
MRAPTLSLLRGSVSRAANSPSGSGHAGASRWGFYSFLSAVLPRRSEWRRVAVLPRLRRQPIAVTA